eukprot:3789291-Amphidinium_carterae.1
MRIVFDPDDLMELLTGRPCAAPQSHMRYVKWNGRRHFLCLLCACKRWVGEPLSKFIARHPCRASLSRCLTKIGDGALK